MNPDDFEQHLQRRASRPVPGEWREAILSAAYAARADRVAEGCVPAGRRFRRYAGWAALAAVWLLIAGIHAANSLAAPATHVGKVAASHQWTQHWREQRRILAESAEPHPAAVESPGFAPASLKSGSRIRRVRASLPV